MTAAPRGPAAWNTLSRFAAERGAPMTTEVTGVVMNCGASFTGRTVSDTLAKFDAASPSLAR